MGQAIVNAMSGIERANPEYLSGVFSSFDNASRTDKSKLSDERLKNLIEHMSELKVGNNNYSADVMGDAYEYLIKKFADLSKKNAGEFYTPCTIVKLMVMLLNPKEGETVYELMMIILASFAQEESRSISENIRWRIKKQFEQGNPNGRFRVYGYRWEGDKLVVVPEEAAVVRCIFQKEYVTDPILKKRKKNRGELPRYYVENTHEPIIDKETFDYV